MKVLLTVAVWGRDYASTLADYSIASQLSPRNLPATACSHELTYHIVTTAHDRARLRRHPNLRKLEELCRVEWDLIEDHDYDPRRIPAGADGEKYPFLSRLQNLAFARSAGHDLLVFNYADFVWADGSLPYAVEAMRDDIDALLAFCLPVDRSAGMRALDRLRAERDGAGVLDASCRAAAAIAIEHLHREARLRLWDNPAFTSFPTYLLWPVEREGLLVRAYHQTVLALRVRPDDPGFREGIPRGSLDGYLTARLAEEGRVRHVEDSDKCLVFSLHRTPLDTSLGKGESRDAALRRCLRMLVSPGQRRFAETPLAVRRSDPSPAAWLRVADESLRILRQYHETTEPDRAAFEEVYAAFDGIEALDRRWRRPEGAAARGALPGLRVWLFRRLLAPMVAGWPGRFAKAVLGGKRARNWRSRLEQWIFPGRE